MCIRSFITKEYVNPIFVSKKYLNGFNSEYNWGAYWIQLVHLKENEEMFAIFSRVYLNSDSRISGSSDQTILKFWNILDRYFFIFVQSSFNIFFLLFMKMFLHKSCLISVVFLNQSLALTIWLLIFADIEISLHHLDRSYIIIVWNILFGVFYRIIQLLLRLLLWWANRFGLHYYWLACLGFTLCSSYYVI